MSSSLTTLRQNAPRMTASQFLAAHPGSWIQYYDDTPVHDPAKALSARAFHLETARRKQQERCAVCFSLQAFGASRTKAGLLSYRNLGVDIDLVPAAERSNLAGAAIDQRKEEYLQQVLSPFPLEPHWLIETRHGFHAIFRIQPRRDPDGIGEAEALNRRLGRSLHGDPNANLLTQLLRVPGTLQFKKPTHPFFCRLLLDNTGLIAPYPLPTIRTALEAWEAAHKSASGISPTHSANVTPSSEQRSRWQVGLSGVAHGQRNTTAASLVGKILGRLPEELWETAGWGGLKEWNSRNHEPLSERELRTVFESITRRERAKRSATSVDPAVPPTRDGSSVLPSECDAER